MSYSMLVRRTPGDDDARLYPALDDPRTVAMESIDGEPLRVKASSIVVREASAGGLRLDAEVRGAVDVLISDARVVVGCVRPGSVGSNYPLVGRTSPGAAPMQDPSGVLVMGQIRYAWLRCVGLRSRPGWRSRKDVRLGVVVRSPEGGLRELFLDLRLAKRAKARVVADAIAMRATRYTASGSNSALEGALYAESECLRDASLRVASDPHFVLYEMPKSAPVSAATAYPADLPSQGVRQFVQATTSEVDQRHRA
jgi:hypothetical protein